jgi:hypothetical protein
MTGVQTVAAGTAPLAPRSLVAKRIGHMSANGMVRPCSRPASKRSWQGARSGVEEPDHRHRLLRARRERPRHRRATEQRDELAASKSIDRIRISEEQSAGIGATVQPVSRWRGRPMSEVGQNR